MGGGGGRITADDVLALEKKAKDKMKELADSSKRNVFISFAVEDLNEVNLLRGQAKNDNSPLEFNDWSVREPFDSKNAEYIKRNIRERIRQSSITVVYLSEHTVASRWVDWEIRESVALGKEVVGTHSGDRLSGRLPAAFRELGLQVVPWKQLSDRLGGQP